MREVFIHTLTLVEVARDIKGIYLDEAHHVIDFYKNMVLFLLKYQQVKTEFSRCSCR
ncbi:Uncharacterised protein [Yersinia enterocolitica]|nr:Uncharacterised protein [Yersinia enterocolitica]CQH06339.1 Uncharacterised protein [Yersinia enterocolitica]CRX48420.1 Uncharacterised protein [Yersinia enterocolitica]